jgi:FkbM family methyltransferase
MTSDTQNNKLAIDYLLMANLNLLDRGEEGPAGNGRLTSLLWNILERLRPTTFFDIGAFDGGIAVAAKQRFPRLLVYSFEANPEIYALHNSTVSAAGVTYLNRAVSDSVGPVKIFAPRTLSRYYDKGVVLPGHIDEPKTTGKTSLLLRNEDAVYEEFNVDGTTLDAFLTEEGFDVAEQRIALWIDAEGAADKVLQGAGRALANSVAVLVEAENFEFWKEQKDSAYITRELIAKGFIPVARDREYGDHQFNILFVKAALIPRIASELFDAQSPLRSCMVSPGPQQLAPSERLKVRPSSSLGAHFQKRIPILIPVFNSVTYLKNMVSQLRRYGFEEIVVIDNASSFPPLLEYLAQGTPDLSVIRLEENKGPHNLFLDPKNLLSLPDHFCITDPDLELNPSLPDDFIYELISLTEKYRVGKAGLALDISDWSKMRHEKFRIGAADYQIWEWEAQFWKNPVGFTSTGDEVYTAAVDTTLAVYNKRFFDPADHLKGVRVGGKYACRHLPWYKDRIVPQEEEAFYRASQRFSYYS